MQIDELPTIHQIDRELATRTLAEFCRQSWHVLEPMTPLVWGWHLDAICEHLEAVGSGEIRNLAINIGPGHMKSILVSVMWTAWSWLRRPDSRWLFSSYAAPLSIRDNLKCRRLIKSPWYQARWGNLYQLADDQDAKTRYENDKTGYRIATSVGGAATGERGNRVVVDDPHNVRERESEAKREATLIWWDEAMSTRLNDPRKDAKIIIQQRVHEKDLTGHVLKQGGYVHLCLPTEYEPARKCVTMVGWEDPRTKAGQLLFPERFGVNEVAEAKLRLGPMGYAGQHQQSPAPAGGGRFKADWFRYYKLSADGKFYQLYRQDGTYKVVSVESCDRFAMMDPAGTEKTQNNEPAWTVIGVWDITPDHDMVKVDHYRAQIEAPDAARHGVDLCRRFDVPWIGVEKDGIGLGVVQTIRRRGVTVRPIKAKGSKEARSETAEIRMAAGMVYFPQGAPWLFDLEKELTMFPNSEFKDQVDELSHAAMWVHRARGAPQNDEDAERLSDEPEPTPDPKDVHPLERKNIEPESMYVGGDDDDFSGVM